MSVQQVMAKQEQGRRFRIMSCTSTIEIYLHQLDIYGIYTVLGITDSIYNVLRITNGTAKACHYGSIINMRSLM